VSFHIIPFKELTANSLGYDFWERQYARDPERYHSPELGMIWYEKRHFIRRAAELDSSTIFIWCDAGVVRDDITETAAMKFGQRGYPLDDDHLHIHQINFPLPTGPYNFTGYPEVLIGGGILAGNRNAWQRFSAEYETSLDEYDYVGLTGISDQYVMARCIWKHPDIFTLHDTRKSTLSRWHYFLELL
jgi:hypothetical protein